MTQAEFEASRQMSDSTLNADGEVLRIVFVLIDAINSSLNMTENTNQSQWVRVRGWGPFIIDLKA